MARATAKIEIAELAGDAVELVSETLCNQLNCLDALARNAGPASKEDQDFLRYYESLKSSLHALRRSV